MIAILQTAFLGDTLLSVPLAKNLRASGEPVALITRKGFADLFRRLELFDRVFEVEKGRSTSYREVQKDLRVWWKDVERRVLVSPHESPRSKFFAAELRFSEKGIQTVGYEDRWPSFALSKLAYLDAKTRLMDLPEAVRQLALLQSDRVSNESDAKLWGARIAEFRSTQSQAGGRDRHGGLLPVPVWASMRIDSLSKHKREKRIVLAPGSVWKTKQWSEQGYVAVGRSYQERGYDVAVVGSPEERELAERVARSVGGTSYAGRIDLWQTLLLIAESKLAIVNDSGAMHLAALADTPCVAVFGPTVLDFGYRPWGEHAKVVEPEVALACRPCGLHGSQRCPVGTHECMVGTSPSRVFSAATTLLN